MLNFIGNFIYYFPRRFFFRLFFMLMTLWGFVKIVIKEAIFVIVAIIAGTLRRKHLIIKHGEQLWFIENFYPDNNKENE